MNFLLCNDGIIRTRAAVLQATCFLGLYTGALGLGNVAELSTPFCCQILLYSVRTWPGLAPVGFPSFQTSVPLTKTFSIPVENS
jgi:hypothetical protein